jgi:hypothetical protein
VSRFRPSPSVCRRPRVKDSGQADKRDPGPNTGEESAAFFYCGRPVSSEQFFENRNRIVQPGPAGLLIAEKIGDVVIIHDATGEILGFARDLGQARQAIADYHAGVSCQAASSAQAEQERQQRLAEGIDRARSLWPGN